MEKGREENLYQFEGAIPFSKGVVFALQHLVALFFSNITPFLVLIAGISAVRGVDAAVISNGIRCAILVSALSTIVQVLPIWKFGSRLPVITGASFTFVGALILIGGIYGLQTMFIALIIGGGVATVLALFAKYWVKFIPPLVSGLVVLGVGLSLLPVGIQQLFGLSGSINGLVVDGVYQFGVAWPYLVVGFLTLISSILFQFLFKGKLKNASILLGVAVGYIASLCFIPYNNMVDFSALAVSSVTDVIDVPRPIFALLNFSAGDVNIGAIIAVTILFLLTMVETMGGVENYTRTVDQRGASGEEFGGAISANCLFSVAGACFGALPVTIYQQNVSIVNQTKVRNRLVFVITAGMMFVISFFPIVSNFLITIPVPVLGGCLLPLFASIAISGFRIIAKAGFSVKNVLILTIALGLGYGLSLVPQITELVGNGEALDYVKIILANPVATMFIIGLIGYYAIPKKLDREE